MCGKFGHCLLFVERNWGRYLVGFKDPRARDELAKYSRSFFRPIDFGISINKCMFVSVGESCCPSSITDFAFIFDPIKWITRVNVIWHMFHCFYLFIFLFSFSIVWFNFRLNWRERGRVPKNNGQNRTYVDIFDILCPQKMIYMNKFVNCTTLPSKSIPRTIKNNHKPKNWNFS